MRKTPRALVAMLALSALAAVSPAAPPDTEKTFRGEIADTQCALGVHSPSQSHKEMFAMEPSVKTKVDCVRYCVSVRGGRFVLQDKDKVYRLDRPGLAEPFAGQQVKIVGTLDPRTHTITVRSVTPVTVAPASANPR